MKPLMSATVKVWEQVRAHVVQEPCTTSMEKLLMDIAPAADNKVASTWALA